MQGPYFTRSPLYKVFTMQGSTMQGPNFQGLTTKGPYYTMPLLYKASTKQGPYYKRPPLWKSFTAYDLAKQDLTVEF